MIAPIYHEQLADGLLYQVFPPAIHSLTLFDTERQTLDKAFELATCLNQAHPVGDLQYLCFAESLSLNPYLLTKLNQSLNLISADCNLSVAVVADAFFAQVVEQVILPSIKPPFRSSVFICSTEKDAFEWLESRRNMRVR
ncbi:MAG: hypothetical protein ACFE0Q_11310 [Anaerolineae bacterium]